MGGGVNETYGRGQVLWAVWQLFLHARYDNWGLDTPEVPSEFEARVRKLWGFGIPIPENERPGTGTSVEYTPYHAFELAVAMALMDMGLNQSEAARFVNDKRRVLKDDFKRMQGSEAPRYLSFRLHEIREGGPHKTFPKDFSIYVTASRGFIKTDEELCADIKQLRSLGLIVLEIGGIASGVIEFLSKAPEIRRGRR